MADAQIRRGGEEYAEGFAALLPRGPAWPRDAHSVLMQFLRGQAEIWGATVDGRADTQLRREADPRAALELLADWERAFGLPDLCADAPPSIDDRRAALVQRMTMLGGQSAAFIQSAAAGLGYDIRIIEHAPFMAGVSEAGDTRPDDDVGSWYRWEIGPETLRFAWRVLVLEDRLTWFRAGSGEAGIDPHLQISIATDLECLIRRLKPAHTHVVFDYSGA